MTVDVLYTDHERKDPGSRLLSHNCTAWRYSAFMDLAAVILELVTLTYLLLESPHLVLDKKQTSKVRICRTYVLFYFGIFRWMER